jgi:hypothetical protein
VKFTDFFKQAKKVLGEKDQVPQSYVSLSDVALPTYLAMLVRAAVSMSHEIAAVIRRSSSLTNFL